VRFTQKPILRHGCSAEGGGRSLLKDPRR
jgi:hypothetical protein